jgi:Zn-finger nucleic acid-binding protein
VRHLVACERCRRQLDAGDNPPGTVLRCACGAPVAVPAVQPHDSAVVRCAACGAPRKGDEEAACRFCGSSFTVHERDLDTVCPGCMARVSGSARFCSHCGSPILVDQASASASPLRCPACSPPRQLGSRRLEDEPVAISDCAVCGGIWVERSVFEILVARARQAQLGAAVLALAGAAAERPAGPNGEAAAPGGPLYRPCAVCGRLMNRQNFGRKSGVIVDLCRDHGLWFDLQELPRVLRWIQAGGEEQARRRDGEEAQAKLRQERLDAASAKGLEPGGWSYAGGDDPDLLESLLAVVGESVRHFFRRL